MGDDDRPFLDERDRTAILLHEGGRPNKDLQGVTFPLFHREELA